MRAYFDSKRERWIAPYVDYLGVRHAPTFKSKEVAKKRLLMEALELESYKGVVLGHTFQEAIDGFLATLTWVRAHTRGYYVNTIELYLAPFLAEMKLTEIEVEDIDLLRAALKLSPHRANVESAQRLLKRILRFAEARFWLPQGRTKRLWRRTPKWLADVVERTRPPALTLQQIELFLTKSEGLPRMIFYLGLLGGFRPSEIAAFKWSDIDRVPGFISVQRTRSKSGTNRPKTFASARDVPISPELRRELDAFKAKTFRGPDTDLFWNSRVPVTQTHNVPYWLAAEQVRLGIGERITTKRENGTYYQQFEGTFGAHRLRATCAALWVRQRVPITRIAKWLGQSDPATTMEVYAFLFADDPAIPKFEAEVDEDFDMAADINDDFDVHHVDADADFHFHPDLAPSPILEWNGFQA